MSGPLGAVLAGGSSRRFGGAKALAPLAGRALISYPLAALGAVLEEVVVVAKPGSALPELEVEVWEEPAEPVHPAVGVLHALERAGGRAVLVCAADMPLVSVEVVAQLARKDAAGAVAVVPRADGRLQPLLARYEPAARDGLAGALAGRPLTEAVAALRPRVIDFTDGRPFTNVNTPDDLAALEALEADESV